jgi:hypothetical protein
MKQTLSVLGSPMVWDFACSEQIEGEADSPAEIGRSAVIERSWLVENATPCRRQRGQGRRGGPSESLRFRCRLGDGISRPLTDLRQRCGSEVLNRYKVVTLNEPSIRDVLIRSAGPGLDHASGGLSKAVEG